MSKKQGQDWPTVAVLLPTYERPEVLARTVELLRQNLNYSGQVKILIGDDSHEPTFRVGSADAGYFFHGGQQYGLGRNLNSLLVEAVNLGIDLVIQQDDDHQLVKPLELDKHVKKLMDDKTAGAIRLMGVGGHKYRANLDGLYWRLDWQSPEVYICSNRPHLKSISRFHGMYGGYHEGFKLGLTEEKFCHTCIDIAKERIEQGLPTVDVLVPLDVLTESSWEHNEISGVISWQARGF